ncbi:activating transcription factor 3-like [Nilaparvata lugens]|uniref:activating transcription factor 3-like n=1 Tax=Nilaparvata lugens TaxID=108931 RepID=UPI00193D5F2C|nr:activating transcription factor 3-like [Nilaparvata lugens]
MYNLNLAGASGSNLLSVAGGESSCTTPRTPEILNSLIAMSNPFDSYRGGTLGPRLASSPPSGSDTNSTCSSGSPSCVSPPSVQLTCSKLIKEGLRHTLQTKRRNNSVSSDAQLSSVEDGSRTCKTEEVCGRGNSSL